MACETRVASEGQYNLGKPWRVTEPGWDIISLIYNYVFFYLCEWIPVVRDCMRSIPPPQKTIRGHSCVLTHNSSQASFFSWHLSAQLVQYLVQVYQTPEIFLSDAHRHLLSLQCVRLLMECLYWSRWQGFDVQESECFLLFQFALHCRVTCYFLSRDSLDLHVPHRQCLYPLFSLVSSRWWSVAILSAISWDLQEHHQEVQTIGNDQKILIWVFQWSYLRILFAIIHNQNLYAVQLPFVSTQKHRDRCAVWKERGLTAR